MTEKTDIPVTSSWNDEVDISTKGKQAQNRLGVINTEIYTLLTWLETSKSTLFELIKDKDTLEKKSRSMIIKENPNRIDFKICMLKFYIDFTIVSAENNLMGSIVYGSSRTLCFPNCKDSVCQRSERCDNLEDKSFIQFLINQYGMIQSAGKQLQDEWWIFKEKTKENTKALGDMHFRALDIIWKDALDWTNENLIP